MPDRSFRIWNGLFFLDFGGCANRSLGESKALIPESKGDEYIVEFWSKEVEKSGWSFIFGDVNSKGREVGLIEVSAIVTTVPVEKVTRVWFVRLTMGGATVGLIFGGIKPGGGGSLIPTGSALGAMLTTVVWVKSANDWLFLLAFKLHSEEGKGSVVGAVEDVEIAGIFTKTCIEICAVKLDSSSMIALYQEEWEIVPIGTSLHDNLACGSTRSDVMHILTMTPLVSTKTNVCLARMKIILTIGSWWWRKHGGIEVCEVCEWISWCGGRWLWFAYWHRRWGTEGVLIAGGILRVWPLTYYLVQALCFNITWSLRRGKLLRKFWVLSLRLWYL